MKILSSEQVAKADAYTVEHEPIKSIDLMERAARACFDWIVSRYEKSQQFLIFCGVGNNGGDGLVIARLLIDKGYRARVIVIAFSDKAGPDFTANLQRFKKLNPTALTIIKSAEFDLDDELEDVVVVDAIFGSGLNRLVKGFSAEVIVSINKAEASVISIDIPSGLFMQDNRKNSSEAIINASHTLSLELPKLAFLFAENAEFVGKWTILPIGLDSNFINECESTNHFTTGVEIRNLLKTRGQFSHKGTFGHALLAGGSRGMIGAAVLMAKGCLRSGVGLVTTVVPRCGYDIVQKAVPETLCKNLDEVNILSGSMDTEGYSALGLGPGIGTHKRTVTWLKGILTNASLPLLLDADAINILSQHEELLESLPKETILTPHSGEFDRLAGEAKSGYDRMEKQVAFAEKYGIYIVLKGKYTAIATPEGAVYFNSSGNAGMATGGAGDVLTGLIAGLLAQGYDGLEACIIGVYIHGMAGDIKSEEGSEQALIAGDMVNGIGRAFLEITS